MNANIDIMYSCMLCTIISYYFMFTQGQGQQEIDYGSTQRQPGEIITRELHKPNDNSIIDNDFPIALSSYTSHYRVRIYKSKLVRFTSKPRHCVMNLSTSASLTYLCSSSLLYTVIVYSIHIKFESFT